jgi:aspartyl-tRNA(Asn)/glutamyl-tRNA(Gln) amidotransferase subunit C
MSFGKQEVQHVAKLARLRLAPQDVERLAVQFDEILGYMECLSAVDTSKVEPMYSPITHEPRLRPDVTSRTCTRADVLANSAEQDGQFYIVPRVV